MLRRALTATLAAVVLVVPFAAPASASVSATPDAGVAAVDGGVYALARAGDRTLVGGVFTTLGGAARTNVGAVLADGTTDPTFVARTNGKVEAVAVSPDGRTAYLGGTFTTVNGVARANLAAVDARTGRLLAAFRSDVTGSDAVVRALVAVGSRLYVAGRFDGIAGTTRKRFAAVDATSGALVAAFNPRANRPVNEIAVSPNRSVVYAAGSFTSLGGQPRTAVGAVSASSGAGTLWAPAVPGGNAVTLALSPDGATLYTTTERNSVFALRTAGTGTIRAVWSQPFDGNTQAIVATASEVYLGGHFTIYFRTRETRTFFASLRATDGALTSWAPQAAGQAFGTWALVADAGHVHAGGVFTSFSGVPQRGYARFSGTP